MMYAENTFPVIIPGGLTKLLQSLQQDIQSQSSQIWESWMTSDEHSFNKTDRMQRARLTDVVEWTLQAWNKVSSSCIKNSFKKAEIVRSLSIDPECNNDACLEIASNISSEIEEKLFNGFSDNQ